ncbi:MAG: ABC transporter permease [Patescibacteria group bacterium]|jgi:putative ABC transport system permease protein
MIIFSETLELAWQSLWRNKLRAFLTMLGIIIGVASVILLISIGAGLKSYITGQFESLGSNLIYVLPGDIQGSGPMGMLPNLSENDIRAIKRIGYPIKDASGNFETFIKARYGSVEKALHCMGVDEAAIEMLNYKAERGRAINDVDVQKTARVAFIGPGAAEKLFENDNPVGRTILIQSTKYRVVGVFESKGGGMSVGMSVDDSVLIPTTTAKKQFNQDKLSQVFASVATKEELDSAKNKVEKVMLKNYDEDEFSVVGQEELLSTVDQILGAMTAGLGGIAAISLLVGGIGIMNIMFVTVTERTREIGLRKALGAQPKDILVQFLIESVTLSLVGGSIGILLAMGGSMVLSSFFASEITLSAVLLAFTFSSVIGVIFGVVPAWKAAKLDPITALRYE